MSVTNCFLFLLVSVLLFTFLYINLSLKLSFLKKQKITTFSTIKTSYPILRYKVARIFCLKLKIFEITGSNVLYLSGKPYRYFGMVLDYSFFSDLIHSLLKALYEETSITNCNTNKKDL